MLEVRNLTKVYRPKKGSAVTALNKVSLKFEDTGMVFVLGKSGSGKSTLLNLMGGLDTITSGEVIIKGKSSQSFTQGDFDSYRNTYLGFIFQDYNILNEFTVGQNIGLALELQGKKANQENIIALMKEVDLDEQLYTRKPMELSGGQKQRIAIARALVKNPEIIMADEPTGALDSNTGKQVFETLQKLAENKLVIIVSHDREYAEFYGDRVIEFKDGKIISDIKKFKAPSKILAGGNITITDDKIIQVKAGHKLTTTEKDTLIKYIEGAPQGTVLSVDPKFNSELHKNARIDAEGNRESFKDSKDSDMVYTNYNESQYKPLKSKLPYRHSLRIGASGLKLKPIRLIFTILLSAIAFAMFGLADTVGQYDRTNATYNSLRDAGLNSISMSKTVYYLDQNGRNTDRDVNLSQSDLATLSTQFPNSKFLAMYSLYGYGGNYSDISSYNLADATKVEGDYWAKRFCGYIPSTEADVIALGFTIDKTNGYWPTSSEEIAITKRVAETFIEANYKTYSGTTGVSPAIAQASDMIGKRIRLGSFDARVTAIVDTGFNAERYAPLKNESQEGMSAMLLAQELQTLQNYGFHQALFTHSSFATKIPTRRFTNAGEASMWRYNYLYSYDEASRGSEGGQWLDGVAKFNGTTHNSDSEITVLDDSIGSGTSITLNEGEVILTANMFQQLFMQDRWVWNGNDQDRFPAVVDINDSESPFYIDTSSTAFGNAYLATGTGRMTAEFKDALADHIVEYLNENYSDNKTRADVLAKFNEVRPHDRGGQWISETYIYGVACSGCGDWYNCVDGCELIPSHFGVGTYTELDHGVMITSNVTWLQAYVLGGNRIEFDSGNYIEDRWMNDVLQEYNLASSWSIYENAKMTALTPIIKANLSTFKITLNNQQRSWNANREVKTDNYRQLQVVGIYDDGTGSSENAILFGATDWDFYDFVEIGDIAYAVVVLPNGRSEALDLIGFSYKKNDDVRYKMHNEISSSLDNVNDMLSIMGTVFFWVGVGFAVFAALLLLNYITMTISYKHKEIGILRAIGARSADVFKIFFNQSLIITIINAILATAIAITACIIIQMQINNMGIMITLLSMGIRQVLLIFAVGIAVAALATFLPVYRMARKKPVEAMKKG